MVDVCLRATSPSTRLEVTVAFTTRVVQRAQEAHRLSPTATVALGRLLTSAGLVALTAKREGTLGAQVTTLGRIRQLMVDANHQGHLRGYARAPELAFPMSAEERRTGRRSVAAGTLPGHLSVVRRNAQGEYTRSAVDLVSGEVDRDVEHYLVHSDQVPTVLVADVFLQDNDVVMSVGALIQAMPDGDRAHLETLRARLMDGGLLALARDTPDPQQLLGVIQPDAEIVEAPVIFTWRCRCSHERVVSSLQLLEAEELAEMIEAGTPAEVACDFCGSQYRVSADEMRAVFRLIARAEG